MARIKWNQVAAPDLEATMIAQQGASDSLNRALQNLQGAANVGQGMYERGQQDGLNAFNAAIAGMQKEDLSKLNTAEIAKRFSISDPRYMDAALAGIQGRTDAINEEEFRNRPVASQRYNEKGILTDVLIDPRTQEVVKWGGSQAQPEKQEPRPNWQKTGVVTKDDGKSYPVYHDTTTGTDRVGDVPVDSNDKPKQEKGWTKGTEVDPKNPDKTINVFYREGDVSQPHVRDAKGELVPYTGQSFVKDKSKVKSDYFDNYVALNKMKKLVEPLTTSKVRDELTGMFSTWDSGVDWGNKHASALGYLNQLSGAEFKKAYETLRGGGSITNIEGLQAKLANNRLLTSLDADGNLVKPLSAEEWDIAVKELQQALQLEEMYLNYKTAYNGEEPSPKLVRAMWDEVQSGESSGLFDFNQNSQGNGGDINPTFVF